MRIKLNKDFLFNATQYMKYIRLNTPDVHTWNRETKCNIQARKIEEMEEEIKRLRAYLERNDKI